MRNTGSDAIGILETGQLMKCILFVAQQSLLSAQNLRKNQSVLDDWECACGTEN